MLSANIEKKLFLLDAYALIYRAYFAFSKNPRINSLGENTSAAFGFTNVLIDIIKNEKPSLGSFTATLPSPTLAVIPVPAVWVFPISGSGMSANRQPRSF